MTPWDRFLTIWMRSGHFQLSADHAIKCGCWGYERDGEYAVAREVCFVNAANTATRWRISFRDPSIPTNRN